MSDRGDRAWSTALKGAGAGASIGTAVWPGIGTAAGAVVGGVAGYIVGDQPIPAVKYEIDATDSYNKLSSQAQYGSPGEFNNVFKETQMLIDEPDPEAQTRDFERIMAVGQALGTIYSGLNETFDFTSHKISDVDEYTDIQTEMENDPRYNIIGTENM